MSDPNPVWKDGMPRCNPSECDCDLKPICFPYSREHGMCALALLEEGRKNFINLTKSKRVVQELYDEVIKLKERIRNTPQVVHLTREDIDGEVWFWDPGGENNLESMGEDMKVLICARDLRKLVGERSDGYRYCDVCGERMTLDQDTWVCFHDHSEMYLLHCDEETGKVKRIPLETNSSSPLEDPAPHFCKKDELVGEEHDPSSDPFAPGGDGPVLSEQDIKDAMEEGWKAYNALRPKPKRGRF